MRFPRFRLRATITTLIGLAVLFAAMDRIGASREAGARAECEGNPMIIGLGLIAHANAKGAFPPAMVPNPALPASRRLSWYPPITTYLHTGFRLDRNEAWDSGSNRVPMIVDSNKDERPDRIVPLGNHALFQCPAHPRRPSPDGPCMTDYVGIAGLGTDAATLPVGDPRAGVFGYERRTRPEDIKDGSSTTLLLAETVSANGPWTAGGPATVRGLDPKRRPYIGQGYQFGGTHPGGAMFAFADGSVRFVREAIDPGVFEALSTIAGGGGRPSGMGPIDIMRNCLH